jgi:hypothetical protein
MSNFIARTGRVQNWIDDPESRLPVSCTVFVVQDSMEGPDGIEASWRFVSHALRNGAGVAVHLSKLRPAGHDNGRGLVSSGPVSFARIYSSLNETLRRGGVYKNGAVVVHLDLDHPDILEFINAKRDELPWVKRCVDLNYDLWLHASQEVKDALLRGIARGDIWLNKIRYDESGNRIFGNVCLEVYLRHRGTCLLQHVNLGQCLPADLPQACVDTMRSLIELHPITGVGDTGEYLDPAVDRQVGMGFIGLANFLRLNGISYAQFHAALNWYIYESDPCPEELDGAYDAVEYLHFGILQAAEIARQAGMDRAFAIAPTVSCFKRYVDLEGFTVAPEIAPPLGRVVDRDSGTFGVERFDHGPVEIASEVGWDTFKGVADGIMFLLNGTGLCHGYSMNTWSDQVTYNEDFIVDFLDSPQSSMYYALPTASDVQDKSHSLAALGSEEETSALLQDILGDDIFAPLAEGEEHVATPANFKIECIGCAE